jgi:hypothetical protein
MVSVLCAATRYNPVVSDTDGRSETEINDGYVARGERRFRLKRNEDDHARDYRAMLRLGR